MGRKDRNSDAPAALNMFPKLLEVPMRTYFMVLAKIRLPPSDPVGEHVQVLFEQQHVGGVLGHIGSRVHRDPDVSGVQRELCR